MFTLPCLRLNRDANGRAMEQAIRQNKNLTLLKWDQRNDKTMITRHWLADASLLVLVVRYMGSLAQSGSGQAQNTSRKSNLNFQCSQAEPPATA
eukprot:3864992-Amphidinium_carterae.1